MTFLPRRKPTPEETITAALDSISSRWHCWKIRGESNADHKWRVMVHLTQLQLALEEDLALLHGERR